MKKKYYLYISLLLIPLVLLVAHSLSLPNTGEVKNVDIQSSDYPDSGSYHINKSARWLSYGKVQLELDVETIIKTLGGNKDVIVLVDQSSSMQGEKIAKAKSDILSLINLILSNENNNVALIGFGTEAELVSGFTNDKNILLTKVNSLGDRINTNYDAALNKLDYLLSNYQYDGERDVIALFITDGKPTNDTPNEMYTYQILKEKYPFLFINGIQYEMGSNIINEIVRISDNQWIADRDSLDNVLYEATFSSYYEKFIVKEYIDNTYFDIAQNSNIKVKLGEFTISEEDGQKVIAWDFGKENFMIGANNVLTIDLVLKDEYRNIEGYYPTSTKTEVTTKIVDEEEQNLTSSLTPVIKNRFKVTYNYNAPSACNLEPVEDAQYFVGNNVTIKQEKPECEGYSFLGWKIKPEDIIDIQKVNDDVFVMPGHDVTIIATWATRGINKSMAGTVYEKATLYKAFENVALTSNNAVKYNGTHQDSMDASKSTENIYTWNSFNETARTNINNLNNVIFGNYCWQMIRTTDTGGVKLIYNGIPDNAGRCGTDRVNHDGYNGGAETKIDIEYYYGTSYIYDEESQLFTLDGTKSQSTWSDQTYNSIIGKYTCLSNDANASCQTLYYVESYRSATKAYLLKINNTANYSQIGVTPFNKSYNSLAYGGYMYGNAYAPQTKWYDETDYGFIISSSVTVGKAYYFGDGIEQSPRYAAQFHLTNAEAIPWSENSSDNQQLVGKYTCLSSTSGTNTFYGTTATTVPAGTICSDGYIYYVLDVSREENHILVQRLAKGNYTPDEYISFSDNIIENADGTITLDPDSLVTEKRLDWYDNYSWGRAMHIYYCGDYKSTTCPKEDARYLIWPSKAINEDYLPLGNTYTFAHDVTYDGEKYILSDDRIETWNVLSSGNYHYLCPNSETECEKVYYMIDCEGFAACDIFTLENGQTIESIRDEMLTGAGTKNNSIVKSAIDAWYEHNLIDYQTDLEDVIFCNDRNVSSQYAWDHNYSYTSSTMELFQKSDANGLYCKNETDRFSLTNEKAKLKYPVALASAGEMYRSYSMVIPENVSNNSWTMSVHRYTDDYGPHMYFQEPNGDIDYSWDFHTTNNGGVRPVISLRPLIEYTAGNGSQETPFIIGNR